MLVSSLLCRSTEQTHKGHSERRNVLSWPFLSFTLRPLRVLFTNGYEEISLSLTPAKVRLTDVDASRIALGQARRHDSMGDSLDIYDDQPTILLLNTHIC